MTRKHQGTGESETSPRRLRSAERQRTALQLRAGGATYQQIADTLNYATAAGALKAVRAGLRATLQEPAAELRTLELERLDALLRGIWPRAIRGEVTAIDRVLKIMGRRAELLGLDAPTRISSELAINHDHAAQLAAQYDLDVGEVIAEAERHLRLLADAHRTTP